MYPCVRYLWLMYHPERAYNKCLWQIFLPFIVDSASYDRKKSRYLFPAAMKPLFWLETSELRRRQVLVSLFGIRGVAEFLKYYVDIERQEWELVAAFRTQQALDLMRYDRKAGPAMRRWLRILPRNNRSGTTTLLGTIRFLVCRKASAQGVTPIHQPAQTGYQEFLDGSPQDFGLTKLHRHYLAQPLFPTGFRIVRFSAHHCEDLGSAQIKEIESNLDTLKARARVLFRLFFKNQSYVRDVLRKDLPPMASITGPLVEQAPPPSAPVADIADAEPTTEPKTEPTVEEEPSSPK